MIKHTLIAGTILTTLLLGNWILENEPKREKPNTAEEARRTQLPTGNPKRTEAKREIPAKTDKKKPKLIIRKSCQVGDAFETADLEEALAEHSPKRGISPIGAFKLGCGEISKLRHGDTISLPQVNGIGYNAKVKRRQKNTNGTITLTAGLEHEDKKYYSVITEGRESVLITLVSPEGSFEMEHYNGSGYIYSTADINNSMMDYSKTDGVSPGGRLH